jgi:hypothetical protein
LAAFEVITEVHLGEDKNLGVWMLAHNVGMATE